MQDHEAGASAPRPGTTRGWAPLVTGPAMTEATAYLESHEVVDLAPDHPLTPRVAFALAQAGRLGEAVVLAGTLRHLDLDIPARGTAAARLDHLADVVGARIWVSWLEQTVDRAAVETGRALVAPEGAHAIEPHRRLMVLYSLAAALASGAEAGDPEVITEALGHLTAARSLAVMFGQTRIEHACDARMAMLHVPGGDLETAARLSRSACSGLGQSEDPTVMGYVRFIADVVLQWSRHYQGLRMEPDVLATIRERLPRFGFDRPASVVAGHVLATAHLQDGDVRSARTALADILASAGFDELGVWRLRPLVTDGYLAAISGDENRVQERIADLARAGAPGEALLARATHLIATGENEAALAALAPLTGGRVRHAGLTLTAACAVEALLLEQAGRPALADQSMRRALGASEPTGALRLFTMHDPAVMVVLAERAVAQRPRDRWARQVLDFVSGQTTVRAEAPRLTVRRPLERDAAGEGAPGRGPDALPSPLTERERQVLALVNRGASQGQMARELFVSLNTIKTHLRSIRQKLGVERTGEAAALARHAGWLEERGARTVGEPGPDSEG